MISGITKKNKINLSDYDYQKDIKNRLLMAHLSVFEVEVLEEILNSSIVIGFADFVDIFDIQPDEVSVALEKLADMGLLTIKDNEIFVDKEMRKYYEFQILKFNDNFKADLEFFQGLMRKVTIHALPTWYSISRTSDNIFESIVEKYLKTPHIYSRYLAELKFEDHILSGIMHDVLGVPDFKMRSHDLREKYALTREQFEEYMLHLEFNLVCFLSYTCVDGQWKEVITPLYEWKQFLNFQNNTKSKAISDAKVKDIENLRSGNFAFISDMGSVLEATKKGGVVLMTDLRTPDVKSTKALLKEYIGILLPTKFDIEQYQRYFCHVTSKVCSMGLAKCIKKQLQYLDIADEWLTMSSEERARHLLKSPNNVFVDFDVEEALCSDRNSRHIERSLESIAGQGWVYLKDFIKGLVESIGDSEGVVIKKRGRRWSYEVPEYLPKELLFIKATILEKFFEAGIVDVGILDGCDCIRLTQFGRSSVV